jgi:hypothetical protein
LVYQVVNRYFLVSGNPQLKTAPVDLASPCFSYLVKLFILANETFLVYLRLNEAAMKNAQRH